MPSYRLDDNSHLQTKLSTTSITSSSNTSTPTTHNAATPLQPQSPPVAIMLRLSPLCSTPLLIDPNLPYEALLSQIEYEVYGRAVEISKGYIFDGLYVEWDKPDANHDGTGNGAGYPTCSPLDKGNFSATVALLGSRRGRDVLSLRVRVGSRGMRLQLN
ncbi:hypothetical protein FQN57_006907 [Myotisia sp. PD_48]|nr:hypothetical protein FQN57_006907 [Myotisia sp. PD_48]